MNVGALPFQPALTDAALLAEPTRETLARMTNPDAWVAAINPDLADTAAFCEHYQIDLGISANCVILEAKRADRNWYAACVILATTKADVNGAIRRHLDARKISFAPMDDAGRRSAMRYGGITPVGLPSDWPVLIDERVAKQAHIVIGSGIRASKLYVSTKLLAGLPQARILDIAKPVL